MSRRDADAFQGGCRTRQRLLATYASASGLGWGGWVQLPLLLDGWTCACGFTRRAPISPTQTSPVQLHTALSPPLTGAPEAPPIPNHPWPCSAVRL